MNKSFPHDWKIKKLEDCMDAIIDYRGKTPKKTPFGIPLVTAKIVKGGRIYPPNEYISPDDYESWMRRGIPEPRDVVMTTEAPLGEIAQLGDDKIALAQRLITLRGKKDEVDNTFLKFIMESDFVQYQLKARASGTTVLGIKQSELRKIDLILPSFNEQKAIAHILGTLDDKIELNRKMNETLEEMARAIFKSWFVDFDPVRAKAEGRKPYGMDAATAALFPDSFQDSPIGKIPKGWKVGKLADCIEIIGGGTPKTTVSEYWDGDIPWFSVVDAPSYSDVFVIDTEKHITVFGVEKSSTKIFREGTTFISARGTVGKCALVGIPMAMNQSCYGIQGKEGMDDYYIYFLLRTNIADLQRSGHGSVFNTITRETFSNIEIVIPSVETIRCFNESVKASMNMILNNLHYSKILADIRDILLPKLLTGEVRVQHVALMAE